MTDPRGGGGPQVPRRRTTQPQRQLDSVRLAALGRSQRRKLCQLLLTEAGARVVEFQKPAAYDELVLEVTPLWRNRRVRVRIGTRTTTQHDLDRLAERVALDGDADGVFIAPLGHVSGVATDDRITLVGPEELIARLERSPLVGWQDGTPAPAFARIGALRGLERDAALLDPVGIRWLPILALNELPPDIGAVEVTPQDLLERVAFRLLTSSFRFGGSRYGEALRGKRVPDSLITWPHGSQTRTAALVDCKASADGYTMAPDHLLRFRQYVNDGRPRAEAIGHTLEYLIVLSSDFPGRSGSRHPFYGRARDFRHECGVQLVYVRAVDLARAAGRVEAEGMDPATRESLDWTSVFSHGLVTAGHLALLTSTRG